MNSLLKNSKKIFTDAPDIDSGLTNRVTTLENNEYKIIYFTEISNSAGSITIPTGATILLDQFQAGVDAYVSTIQNGQPTGDFPKTSGGTTVDVTLFDSLGNYTLSGTPSSYPVALIYVFKIKAKDYNNLNINKILDLEGLSKKPVPNPQEIYVDFNIGNDTTGNGSVVAPYKTIQHALTFTTDPLLRYTLILAPATYTGADAIIPANVSIEGNGAVIDFNLTLGSVGLAGTEQQPFYVTCSFKDFTFDLSPFLICLPTFDNCGIDKLIRTDTTAGAYVIRFSDGSINDFSVKGTVAFDNTLLLNTGTVENGGTVFLKNTIVGVEIDLQAGSILTLIACVFIGPTGVIDALDPSAIVNIDSTSASGFGGTIYGSPIVNYLDNAETIKYTPTTPADWSTPPDTVEKALDTLAAEGLPSQAGNSGKYLTTNGTTASWASVSGGGLLSGTATGTNNYSVTIAGVTSYTNGDAYLIKFTNGSDADSDIDINGLGVKNLVKEFNLQLTGGDIISGQELLLVYDGTNFQCIGVAPNQLFAYVTNDDSVTINKGQPVYAFSAAGNRMSVKLANNTSDATSAQTVGVVYSTSIAPNQRGFIITQGVINGLNTAAYSPGDQLYLGNTAGSLTNVKPYAPNHLVYVGIVERANAGNGQIYIKPQNGYELDEIHDVDLKSVGNIPANNDVLTYVTGVNNLWKPRSITTILGYTPENVSNKSTTTTLGTSDTLYPTQNAVKTYVDAQVATVSQAARLFNYYNFI